MLGAVAKVVMYEDGVDMLLGQVIEDRSVLLATIMSD
jgi:hypothetical protein